MDYRVVTGIDWVMGTDRDEIGSLVFTPEKNLRFRRVVTSIS